MAEEDDAPETRPVHEVGMVLDALSIEELQERIGLLEGEIGRLKQAIKDKSDSKSAAESVFKF